MGKILQIAWNDIRIEFSEKATLVFFLILPIVFTVILGAGVRNGSDSDDSVDRRYVVLVVDEDQSGLSARFRSLLEASHVVRPDYRETGEAIELFEGERAAGLLTLPTGFEEGLLSNRQVDIHLVKASQNNQAYAVEEALQAAVTQMGSAVAAAQASLDASGQFERMEGPAAQRAYLLAGLDAALDLLAEPPVRVETTAAEEVDLDIATGFQQSSSGQLVTWTLITMLGASEVFVNERLGGTLKRLLITPTRRSTIFLGKVAGRLSLGLFQMALLISFGMLVLGVEWGRSPAALILVMVSFALAAVGLGTLLATFSKSRGQASGLTILFSMLLAALGGAWWPLEITPPAYQQAVIVLPTTWAMQGFNDVIVRGLGVSSVLPVAGTLLLFALVFFAVGLWRLNLE